MSNSPYPKQTKGKKSKTTGSQCYAYNCRNYQYSSYSKDKRKSLFTSKYMALVTTISKSNTLTSITVGLIVVVAVLLPASSTSSSK